MRTMTASSLTDQDLYWFNEGTHQRLHEKLGAHPRVVEGVRGTTFAVWAPNARSVHVMGDFNEWSKVRDALQPRNSSGIWEGFLPDVGPGARYKYYVASRVTDYAVDKTDPFAFYNEVAPQTASVICDLDDFQWNDDQWVKQRLRRQQLDAPISIYELHLGSWMRDQFAGGRMFTYREIAPKLAEYVKQLGFTHVEFLPIMEHPFYGSWGYQTTGYFAPSSRYGMPQDLMYLIDHLHQQEIGVILDWVPSHFVTDAHGLGYFDGSHLYEHADRRQGWHPDWDSNIFNYGRNEVRSFLLSSAKYWLDKYHIDGLRVDAVASMLYLDYSRKAGEWIPNIYGGRENLEAIYFLRTFNERVYQDHPDTITIAEESTAWPMVSRPTYVGGLGFGYKWDMGWMHDTLEYMQLDPVFRKYEHGKLPFRLVYAFSENFVLPLSHDEVVHGKRSLLEKMPGDDWRKFANLRILYGYMYSQPGKKLLFMGCEIAQRREWNHDLEVDWFLLEHAPHSQMQHWVQDLNRAYREEPALHSMDCDPAGFEWIDCHDAERSVISYARKGRNGDWIIVICNMTPVPRPNYRIGVPHRGFWAELLNSDAAEYGGSGYGNLGGIRTTPIPFHGRPHSLNLTLPPLAVLYLKYRGEE